MLDLRLLQAAIAIAEERSVTHAADRLHLTQPALSKQLAELEERVGCVLFVRKRRKFEITEAGASFVEHARIALTEVDRAIHSGRSASLGAENTICVAKSPYIDPYFVSVMRSIRLPLYPKLTLRFSSHFSGEAIQRLRSGGADLALTTSLHEQSGVTSHRLATDAFFVAFQIYDRVGKLATLALSDLQHRRIAMLERHVNPQIYDKLQELFEREAVHPTDVQHVQSAEEAAALILQTDYLALLTKNGAWRISSDAIDLRPLRDGRLELKTYLSARLEDDSRLLSEFTRSFVRRLEARPKQTALPLVS